MKTFDFEIGIEANTELEAEQKLEAFTNMEQSLEHEDFVTVAKFVTDYPETVKMIKETLPSLSGADTTSLIFKAPDIIKKIKAAIEADESNLVDDED